MMSAMRLFAITALLLALWETPAWADSTPATDTNATTPSDTDACRNLKSSVQVYEALNSKTPEMVMRGMKCGLLSDESESRGMVISKYLSDGSGPGDPANRASAINLMVDANADDTQAAKLLPKMPDFSVWNVHWSAGGHQFSGAAPFCCQNSAAGNLIGSTLTITYQNWPIPTDKGPQGTTCTARMTLNKDRTRMEGPLRCQNLDSAFQISLGIQ